VSWGLPEKAREAQQARWQALKAAHPGAEVEYQASRSGRTVRGRLGPGEAWTPWRLSRDKVLRMLEEQAAAGALVTP
jgi:hypothetical protein